MRAYSADFRFSVVRAYENGQGSQRQLARLFGVSVSFVQNLLQHYRRTGSVRPKPHKVVAGVKLSILRGGGPDAAAVARCFAREMCERLAAETHVTLVQRRCVGRSVACS